MNKIIVSIFVAIAATIALLTSPSEAAKASCSTCLPSQYSYAYVNTVDIYRVFFVREQGADIYRLQAGPFFTLEKAQQAKRDIDANPYVLSSAIQVSTPTWRTVS